MFQNNLSFSSDIAIMNKDVQWKISRYICSRVLENECGFSSSLNSKYEKYYTALDQFYKPCTFPVFPSLETFVFNEINYLRAMRSCLYAKNEDGKPSIKSFIIIYLATKLLIIEFNKFNQGFHFVGWMNNIFNDNEINWDNLIKRSQSICQIL